MSPPTSAQVAAIPWLWVTCLPFVLTAGQPPTATVQRQLWALAAWGAACAWMVWHPCARIGGPGPLKDHQARTGHALIGALLAAATGGGLAAGVPASVLAASLGTVVAAWGIGTVAYSNSRARALAPDAAAALCVGLALAGGLSVIVCLLQVFAPSLTGNALFAPSPGGGRAYGNLRQPNQLGTLVLWSLVAAVALWERHSPRHRAARIALLAAWAMGLLTLVLSGSRTAALGTAVLCVWGLWDRRLSSRSRRLMAAAPLGYAGAWWAMRLWSSQTGQAFGAERLVTQTENLSSSRFEIWSNAMALIAAHPWTGVGWGNFNFAWTLTPMAQRPGEYFDHPHNIVLHLSTELGLPLALLTMGLLVWGLVSAWRRACHAGVGGAEGRAFVVMLCVVGLHSLLEYPLWYAYFLLPSAFMLGHALGLGNKPVFATPADAQSLLARGGLRPWPGVLCVAGVAGAAWAAVEVREVGAIFDPSPSAPPLEQRITRGQRTMFFSHLAHYAAATTAGTPSKALPSFQIAAGHLIDARLMMGWSQALADAGDLDRARTLAARLREFQRQESAAFFAPCGGADRSGSPVARDAVASQQGKATLPHQCQPPSQPLGWRDFRR